MNTADVFFFFFSAGTASDPHHHHSRVCPLACRSSGLSVGVSVLSMSQIEVGFSLEHYSVIQVLNTDYSQPA